jgi:hypothetical protein
MKVRYFNITLLNVFLLVTLSVSVYGNVYNTFYGQASPISAETPKVVLQSGTAGTSTIYTNNTSARVSVAAPVLWLSGWDKRVKITINSTDIDTALTDFPVLVYLSNSSSGENDEDVSFVFDEIENSSKKIAVTTSDGTTQCYVEIEKWDDVNEQAWLWVKVPSLSSTDDTDLYLYYDKDHVDNTNFIGDPNSTAAENIWDSSFVAVWHLGELTGGTGAIIDSTSKQNDGSDNGGPALGATGKIGNAIQFDGSNDSIIVPDDASLRLGDGLTIEAWINIDTWGDWEDIVFKGGGNAGDSDYQFALVNSGLAWDGTYNGNWRSKYFPTSKDTGTWIYTAVTHDTLTVKCYRNGSEISSQSDEGTIYESTYQLAISQEDAANRGYLHGKIDEVRVSKMNRSAAWIKATYESERDDLLDFGSEETSWLNGWSYRKSHVINNATGAGTLYQVKITVYYGSGTDSQGNVYLNSKCRTDFGDIRYTSSDGSTLLSYWFEKKVDSDYVTTWVKVSEDLSSVDRTIYIYYGKSDATTASNGTNTFIYFDDFSGDLSKWTTIAGTWGISGGKLYCSAGTGRLGMYITGSSLSNAAIDYVGTTPISDDNAHGSGAYYRGNGALSGGDVFIRGYWHFSNNRWEIKADTTFIATNAANSPEGTTKLHSMRFYGTSHKMYADDVLVVSGTSALGTSPGKVGVTLYYTVSGVPSGIYWDDYRVRKYVEPEPTHGSWGSEESGQTFDHVLEVVNKEDTWKIRLRAFDQSDIGRLSNCTVYLHDGGGVSLQIYIYNGAYSQQFGNWYNLTSISTVYIAMTVSVNSPGISYVYAYLEVLIPSTSTYNLMVITFEAS